ncbi:MAG TPA: hypothetical protein VFJ67_04320 [Thermodesulfobacteriota bacterium]|nr:hypothetical protein [Thermodesulfobacteriota bacterium]
MSKRLIVTILAAAFTAALAYTFTPYARESGPAEAADSSKEKPADNPGPAAAPVKELTLDEILGKYYKAIGGLADWGTLNTLAVKGKIVSQNAEIATTAEYMRPDKCRLTYKIGGKLVVQSFNGRTAWQQSAMSESVAPELLDAGRTAYLRDRCAIESPLIDYAKKNLRVTLEGRDIVDGKDAYKIKVTYASGNFQYYLLNSASFLPVKAVGFYTVDGKEVVMMTRFRDYTRVGSLLIPFKLEIEKKGNAPREEYIVESVIPNPPIDPAIFNMP